jgi:hypothetical protein
LERGLREKLQAGQITSQEKQQLADIDARKALQTAQFGFEGGQNKLERDLREKLQAGQITAQEQQQLRDLELRRTLGLGELTGMVDGRMTMQAQQNQQRLLIELANVLSGSGKEIPADLMAQLMRIFGTTPPKDDDVGDGGGDDDDEADGPGPGPGPGPVNDGYTNANRPVGTLSPDGQYRWNGQRWVSAKEPE